MKHLTVTRGAHSASNDREIFDEDVHGSTQESVLDLEDLRDIIPSAHAIAATRVGVIRDAMPEYSLFDRYPGT